MRMLMDIQVLLAVLWGSLWGVLGFFQPLSCRHLLCLGFLLLLPLPLYLACLQPGCDIPGSGLVAVACPCRRFRPASLFWAWHEGFASPSASELAGRCPSLLAN